jgi:hypothetical protein
LIAAIIGLLTSRAVKPPKFHGGDPPALTASRCAGISVSRSAPALNATSPPVSTATELPVGLEPLDGGAGAALCRSSAFLAPGRSW